MAMRSIIPALNSITVLHYYMYVCMYGASHILYVSLAKQLALASRRSYLGRAQYQQISHFVSCLY